MREATYSSINSDSGKDGRRIGGPSNVTDRTTEIK